VHPNDANAHTPELKTQPSARRGRRRARRLALPTAAVVGVLTAALVGSGFSGSTTAATAEAPAARTGVVTLTAGTSALAAASTATTATAVSAGTAQDVVVADTKAVSTKAVSSRAAAKAAKAKKAKAKKAARAKAKMKAKKRLKKMTRLAKKAPRKAAKKMLKHRGYSARQHSCLVKLWNKESNWRWNADNPSSSAYGIPQALPGRKMASAGRDWRTNPVTQIKWGLKYIKGRYGSPCGAWSHSKARGWY